MLISEPQMIEVSAPLHLVAATSDLVRLLWILCRYMFCAVYVSLFVGCKIGTTSGDKETDVSDFPARRCMCACAQPVHGGAPVRRRVVLTPTTVSYRRRTGRTPVVARKLV